MLPLEHLQNPPLLPVVLLIGILSLNRSDMTTTEPIAKNTSPFLSIFHRKKRVNGTKSSDDIKVAVGIPREQTTETAAEKKRNTKKHESTTLPAKLDSKKKKHKPISQQPKSLSFDVLLEEDPAVLVEALETIAAEQPIVARSIPKHTQKSLNGKIGACEIAYSSKRCTTQC
ncbi:hypothetical protein OSTOST_01550 [Ostertagia ostertagi]